MKLRHYYNIVMQPESLYSFEYLTQEHNTIINQKPKRIETGG